ncbi:restriction endonuclease subunit S [Marinovum sp. 2_MG-2023]|uniref:restriction endonuclease subunit S n=1 Tax=unclassified Marinovum TaxID=2647166 RepID=UPI0026E37958|nr:MULTISPECIES: restriction endonuclease subunit S [unclassified Marinovum]MDO6732905.1 restriction endonuclease subunit S [Marinovum sp. 2_MG-2023]MDO6782185.1 restriction endonuclease subunit S [Marinovum sp. 1_MG-2023]
MNNYVPLGDIVDIKGGGTPDKKVAAYWDGDIPWASVKDFKSGTLDRTVDRITAAGVAASATNIIPAGHIIVPTRMAVGKAAINTIDLAINQDLKALFPKVSVDTRYLYNALLANSGKLLDQATGATVKGIKLDALRGLKIPLPPLEEQKRISGILDQADALRRLRTRALDRLNTLGQAILLECQQGTEFKLTDVEFGKLAENTRNAFCNGPFGSNLLRSELTVEGVPVIYIRDIASGLYKRKSEWHVTQEKAQELSGCAVNSGDLLLSKVGDPPCAAAIYPAGEPPAIITQDVIRIRIDPERALAKYLAAFFNTEVGRRAIKPIIVQATRARVSLRDLKGLKLSLPPIEAQRAAVLKLEALDNQRNKSNTSLLGLQSLFASLQHCAFRGEL